MNTIPDINDLLAEKAATTLVAAEAEYEQAMREGGDAVKRLEARIRQDTLGSRRGPSPTPPGATRDPKRPGITLAPKVARVKAEREARRRNRARK